MSSAIKSGLSSGIAFLLRSTASVRRNARRIYSHAHLASQIRHRLPASVVVEGAVHVFGTGNVRFGEDCLLYPGIHLETQHEALLVIEDGVVISRGAHLVAMADVSIGRGTMIGEYASIRDANHTRTSTTIRNSPHIASPIVIGREVWIGRGVTILQGLTIGDYATIGANAVVTRDVPAGEVVAGVPAKSIRKRESED